MSANLDRLSRQALRLSAEEKMQLVEALLESLASDAGRGELSPEEKRRLGELWDEGIASGPVESLPMGELIARARLSFSAACERRLDAYLSGYTSARDAEDVLAKPLEP